MNGTPLVGLLNPSVDTDNLGDLIIADAVKAELARLLPQAEIIDLPTQRSMSRQERRLALDCDGLVVGGTNILNGNLPFYRQWKLDPDVVWRLRGRTTSMGVGWWKYQPKTNALSGETWRTIFRGAMPSVRDKYTEQKFVSLGIDAINTACPTMWSLPAILNAEQAPKSRVVVTLTDYLRSVEQDIAMFRALKEIYDEVYLWPQGEKDEDYAKKLRLDIKIGKRTLEWFDSVLDTREFDYAGTRLHAGVRAHQKHVHAQIIALDNRSIEISRDTGLPIVYRNSYKQQLHDFQRRQPAKLRLPQNEIRAWKNGFTGWILK